MLDNSLESAVNNNIFAFNRIAQIQFFKLYLNYYQINLFQCQFYTFCLLTSTVAYAAFYEYRKFAITISSFNNGIT